MSPSGQKYKVKLNSGRVLGPIDLDRIRALIRKNQILGVEVARKYPEGEWQNINAISEIADLLLENIVGVKPNANQTVASDEVVDPLMATRILPENIAKEKSGGIRNEEALPVSEVSEKSIKPGKTKTVTSGTSDGKSRPTQSTQDTDNEATRVFLPRVAESNPDILDGASAEESLPALPALLEEEGQSDHSKAMLLKSVTPENRKIADEQTILFSRNQGLAASVMSGGNSPRKDLIKKVVLGIVMGIIGYQVFLADTDTKPQLKYETVRPYLPRLRDDKKADSAESAKVYEEGIKYYVTDTVVGYTLAVQKLQTAASLDPGNVKALSFLASSYLNLIDSTTKDENYFSVITKLIDLARSKGVDLPEIVIADVEFYLTVHKPEAAQSRIVEYTKSHETFGFDMFYYLALSLYARGDFQAAANYISQYPEKKAFSPKIFYLKGEIAEKLNDPTAAFQEYEKAVRFNKNHAKSHLKLAELLSAQGKLREAAPHLEFIVTHPGYLSPKHLAQGYFLHAQLSELGQKWDVALADVERSVRLDHENHSYLLELYTLRAKAGSESDQAKKEAKMYYRLGEGEKLLKVGKYQEALVQFLAARQANDASAIPLVKIGDMFRHMHDLVNAKANYKAASVRAPNNIEVWSRYMELLIESYEWDEAQRAMNRFRGLPVNQSSIDKAAADMYEKQDRFSEAQLFYRKAMARDAVDSEVYIAYARSLMATKNYKEAPFFFSLALRFDPLNSDALIGIAKCIANTESVERAIHLLQDELQKGFSAKAELLAAVAELQIQQGDWELAQQTVDQARAANPDYAFPWKLQALIELNKEGIDKKALDQALYAYKAYSDRNQSDPTGYLERYRIYIRKTEYEKASDELEKIYAIYPKYPNLHYFKGLLYSMMGNQPQAIQEYNTELGNNPGNAGAMLALGQTYLKSGSPDEALKIFTKAMQAAPKSSEARQQAAWSNYLLKNYAAAVALYNSAIAIDTGNPILYKRLGLAYRDMGDEVNAGAAFKKYLLMEPDAVDRFEFERYR